MNERRSRHLVTAIERNAPCPQSAILARQIYAPSLNQAIKFYLPNVEFYADFAGRSVFANA